jgi:prepilin-type processing-associated H-X9-DG protein
MHQYGIAFHNHSDANKGGLPIGLTSGGTTSKGNVGACTWVVMVWPFLELDSLAGSYNYAVGSTKGANQNSVKATPTVYYCPSTTRQNGNNLLPFVEDSENRVRARSNYVVCFGHGTRARGNSNSTGAPYYQLNLSSGDGAKWRGSMFTADVEMFLSDVKDGLSNTVALSEAPLSDRGDQMVLRGDVLWNAGLPYFSSYKRTPNSPAEDWLLNSAGFNGNSVCSMTANAPCRNNVGSKHDDCQTARSNHTGGVNVVMGDGSVTFINNNIVWKEWGIICSAWSQGKSPVPTAYQ